MSRSEADRSDDILAAVVVHEYFRVNSDLIRDVLDNQLAQLAASVRNGPRDPQVQEGGDPRAASETSAPDPEP